jgi:hypothetical protein
LERLWSVKRMIIVPQQHAAIAVQQREAGFKEEAAS